MTLSEYLKCRSVTPTALSRLLGVNRRTVYRWLDEKVVPKPSMIRKIAEITGGDVNANSFYPSIQVDRGPHWDSQN